MNFLPAVTTTQALWPTQPLTQCLQGTLTSGAKWTQREADHLFHLVLRLRMSGAIRQLTHTSSWCGASLIQHIHTLTHGGIAIEECYPCWSITGPTTGFLASLFVVFPTSSRQILG